MKYRSYKFTFLVSFILPFLIVACQDEKDRSLDLIVTNEFKLSEKTQEHLHRMYTDVVSSSKAQEVAFSNYVSPINVVITDYKGKFVEKIGQEGRGPNEILSARYFGFDDNQNLVVLDKASALFKYFNRSTKEVASYKYPIKKGISVTSRNLEMCDDRWYMGIQLLGESTDTATPIIGVFNSEFNIIDTLGAYDPFFQSRTGILQESVIKVDCGSKQIYTTHAKVPYIQVFSLDNEKEKRRTKSIPNSFMLSDKFITMVTNPREMNRFLSEEQSISLSISYTDKYLYHIFRNERNIITQPRNLNDSDYFVAVYDKRSLEYLGETKLPGAVLGSTREGDLIVLKNELTSEIQFIKVVPMSKTSE